MGQQEVLQALRELGGRANTRQITAQVNKGTARRIAPASVLTVLWKLVNRDHVLVEPREPRKPYTWNLVEKARVDHYVTTERQHHRAGVVVRYRSYCVLTPECDWRSNAVRSEKGAFAAFRIHQNKVHETRVELTAGGVVA